MNADRGHTGDIAPPYSRYRAYAVGLFVLAIFIIWLVFGKSGGLEAHQVLSTKDTSLEGFLTHQLFHTDGIHLCLNMLVILMAGGILESYWGTKRFLFFFVSVAFGVALASLGLGALATRSTVLGGEPAVSYGASGLALGCLVCMAVAFPHGYIVRGLAIRHLVWALIFLGGSGLMVLDYRAASSPTDEGVMRGSFLVSQLSGVGIALFYIWAEPRVRVRLRNLSVRREGRQRQKIQEMRRRVDLLLDKINESGYDSLTLAEKAFLKQASKYYKQEK